MEAILTNTEGVSNGVYYLVLDVCYKDWLELKGTNGTILEGTKGRSLRCDNTYRRYQQYKGANWPSS